MMDQHRLTTALIRHARHMMPPSQADWGAAMAREAQHIEGRAALTWALGCVAASYGERLRAEHYLLPLLGRLYLACVCIGYAIGHLVSPPYPQLLCRLFGQAPLVFPPFPFTIPFASLFQPAGVHYSPAASCYFMPAAPLWLSALTVARSALCLMAAWWLVRGRAAAVTAFLLAALLGAAGIIQTVFVFAVTGTMDMHPYGQLHGLLLTILFGVLYPLIIGTCIALLVRRDAAKKAAD